MDIENGGYRLCTEDELKMGGRRWVILHKVSFPPITFADEDENEEEDE